MNSTDNNPTWYQAWFDSPYYHLLYRDRDQREAQFFIDRLCEQKHFPMAGHILDLACGRGRHARYLRQKGCRVTGLDLAANNIAFAQRFADDKLDFVQGDMREPYGENRYDGLLNLFTSFGYFEHYEDNVRACAQMQRALKPGGWLILDFMNVTRLRQGLVAEEQRQIAGIDFRISRSLEGDRVHKDIYFAVEGESHHYRERVQLLELDDFERLFSQCGFELLSVYGSYALEPFDPVQSERLILKARA